MPYQPSLNDAIDKDIKEWDKSLNSQRFFDFSLVSDTGSCALTPDFPTVTGRKIYGTGKKMGEVGCHQDVHGYAAVPSGTGKSIRKSVGDRYRGQTEAGYADEPDPCEGDNSPEHRVADGLGSGRPYVYSVPCKGRTPYHRHQKQPRKVLP